MEPGYLYLARDVLQETFDGLAKYYKRKKLVSEVNYPVDISGRVHVLFRLASDPQKAVHIRGHPNQSSGDGSDMHIYARLVDYAQATRVGRGVQADIDDVPTLQELPSFGDTYSPIWINSRKELGEILAKDVPALN